MGKLNPPAEYLDRIFWEDQEERLSYREVLAKTLDVSFHFAGLTKGDLVVLEGFPPRDAWVFMLSAWQLELSVLPIAKNAAVQIPWSRKLRFQPEDIKALVGESGYRHACDLYILTSGSTGSPKAIGHRLEGLIASALATLQFYGFTRDDSWLLSLDPSHIGGFQILLRTWLAGGKIFYGGEPREIAESIIRWEPRFISLVPTQLFILLEDSETRDALKKTKVIMLGGASTQVNLLERIRELALPISITYGSSETASQISAFPPAEFPERSEDVGILLPIWSVESRETKLWIDGPALFEGYFQNNLWHAASRPFALPDRGTLVDGRLFIEGRSDQIFQVGGENVSPAEILAVLEPIVNLGDLLLIPKVDKRFGHVPLLVIRSRLKPELKKFLTALAQLKPIKRPREIWWFESSDVRKFSRAQVEANLVDKDDSVNPPFRLLWAYDKL